MNTRLSRTLCTLGVSLIAIALLVLSVACAAQRGPPSTTAPGQPADSVLEQDAPPTPARDSAPVDTKEMSPPKSDRSTDKDCPGVDSQLAQIVRAPDPLAVAQQLGLRTMDDKIQVLLVLNGPDTSFLSDFEAEVGTQSGTQVQAFVPPTRVCELASAEQVSAVRLPSGAVTQ